MDLLTPDLGLIFWIMIAFGVVVWILKKYAWKPILSALKEREDSITNSLKQAEKAREEMAQLQSDHELILNDAKEQRSKILKEAKELKEGIISEAKDKAKSEADKIVASAKVEIHNEKMAALIDVKNQLANLSIEIAEKIIKHKLGKQADQEALINEFLEDIKLN